MSQNLKKETCPTDNCYPKCPVYNLLQRRIVKLGASTPASITDLARNIQDERCPHGKEIVTDLLKPAKTITNKRQSLTW